MPATLIGGVRTGSREEGDRVSTGGRTGRDGLEPGMAWCVWLWERDGECFVGESPA